jgi:hypothetical protein
MWNRGEIDGDDAHTGLHDHTAKIKYTVSFGGGGKKCKCDFPVQVESCGSLLLVAVDVSTSIIHWRIDMYASCMFTMKDKINNKKNVREN